MKNCTQQNLYAMRAEELGDSSVLLARQSSAFKLRTAHSQTVVCHFEKNMNEPIIIEELGKIWGRDAIFLDGIEFDGTNSVKLIGDFNGSLCENVKSEKWISYELTFKGILEFKITELDFFSNTEYSSSFEKVIDSDKLNGFVKSSQNFKLKDSHEHYIFHTYDDVIELVANEFELKLKPKKE